MVAITGGARGIGLATAAVLLGAGMKVALGDLDSDRAQQAAAELGAGAIGLPLDVTDSGSFAGFLDAAAQVLGPLSVLVNNAGIMHVGRFVDEDEAQTRRMVETNLIGVILGTRLALQAMMPRNAGHIINIASQAGRYGAPGGATYSATKHAVVGLTEAVRGELQLARSAVQISYVLPFAVQTELGAGLGRARGMRMLQPEEVADAVLLALRRSLVDVWVPRSAKRTHLLGQLLPRRLAEASARAMKANLVLAGADPDARAEYERRIALEYRDGEPSGAQQRLPGPQGAALPPSD